MDKFAFPVFTHGWVVLSIFVAELIFFHAVLVFWLKLGKRARKIVDYIWLSLAALGVFGAAGQARHSQEGAVCRTFVRSQFSPPPAEFERAQKDFDSVCHWFWDVQRKLPRLVDVYPDLSEVDAKNLPSEPVVPETDLRDILRGFHDQVDLYNTDARELRSIVRASKQSSPEQFLVFTAPLLLSFAIALRITKVTGELRLG